MLLLGGDAVNRRKFDNHRHLELVTGACLALLLQLLVQSEKCHFQDRQTCLVTKESQLVDCNMQGMRDFPAHKVLAELTDATVVSEIILRDDPPPPYMRYKI